MSDGAVDDAPVPPEALVRVQPISDPKAFKRHLLRTFEQGQPCYAYADELDADPWKLWPELVPDSRRLSSQSTSRAGGGNDQSSPWR